LKHGRYFEPCAIGGEYGTFGRHGVNEQKAIKAGMDKASKDFIPSKMSEEQKQKDEILDMRKEVQGDYQEHIKTGNDYEGEDYQYNKGK